MQNQLALWVKTLMTRLPSHTQFDLCTFIPIRLTTIILRVWRILRIQSSLPKKPRLCTKTWQNKSSKFKFKWKQKIRNGRKNSNNLSTISEGLSKKNSWRLREIEESAKKSFLKSDKTCWVLKKVYKESLETRYLMRGRRQMERCKHLLKI